MRYYAAKTIALTNDYFLLLRRHRMLLLAYGEVAPSAKRQSLRIDTHALDRPANSAHELSTYPWVSASTQELGGLCLLCQATLLISIACMIVLRGAAIGQTRLLLNFRLVCLASRAQPPTSRDSVCFLHALSFG